MNQLTTIASLPGGSGQAAHLPAEVGRTSEQWTPRVFPGLLDAAKLARLGYQVNESGCIERLPAGRLLEVRVFTTSARYVPTPPERCELVTILGGGGSGGCIERIQKRGGFFMGGKWVAA